MNILKINDLVKIYKQNTALEVKALSNLNFTMEKGEFVAVMGESGSGKTTLLNIISMMEKSTSGDVIISGENIGKIKDKDRAIYRREHLGYIFQDYNILDIFTVKENIELPLILNGMDEKLIKERLDELVEKLNISYLLDKYPYEISGGEAQRVSIARSLMNKPDLLLADEPTGALDSKNTVLLMKLLSEINHTGQSILMVTHSAYVASFASRVVFLRDGKFFHEIYKAGREDKIFEREITAGLSLIGEKR